jgi:hypothetical protein
MLSRTKSLPIVVILFLISLDIVARRLSNVLLHGILDNSYFSALLALLLAGFRHN